MNLQTNIFADIVDIIVSTLSTFEWEKLSFLRKST